MATNDEWAEHLEMCTDAMRMRASLFMKQAQREGTAPSDVYVWPRLFVAMYETCINALGQDVKARACVATHLTASMMLDYTKELIEMNTQERPPQKL